MNKATLLPLLPLVLMGCAAPEKTLPNDSIEAVPESEAGGFECDAASSQSLVGQKATKELGERVVKNTGARAFRWLAPNTAVTMEYSPVRVNVTYDEQMIVTSINCG